MELPCIVSHVAYRNDNGFAILACTLDTASSKYSEKVKAEAKAATNKKYGTFTVSVGMLGTEENPVGGEYIFVGEWQNNAKYGLQFKADMFYQGVPTTEAGLVSFLRALPNIKESRSRAILAKWGVQGTIDILDHNPYVLTEINGITDKRVPPIKEAWDSKKYLRDLFDWLTLHKIPTTLADKIYKKWGKTSLEVLTDNPYKLVELYGVGFVTADKIAHQIKEVVSIDYRVTACLKYVLEENTWSESNLYMPYREMAKKVVDLINECDESMMLNSDNTQIAKRIAPSIKNNPTVFGALKDKIDGSVSVYLLPILQKEERIAKMLYTRSKSEQKKSKMFCDDRDIAAAEAAISDFHGKDIKLDQTQKDAIKSAFNSKITVITGGGGTGKSTLCQCIYKLAQNKNLTVRMMSPTGKAAQVLSEKTGCGASTIHRSLRMLPDDDEPKEQILEDIVIIDEISMSGIDTMYAILSAMERNQIGNLILVGDKNQLPSVSPGNFLFDIMAGGVANVVTLDRVHRQDENSYIAILANDMAGGKVIEIPEDASDIHWTNLNPDTYKTDLNRFIDKYLEEGKDIDDLQVISPMKKGTCGVNQTNAILQERMAIKNGTQGKFIQRGFNKFFVGDRVIQTENNYEKEVFNGDMGIIVDIGERAKDIKVSDQQEKFVTVAYYDRELTYYGESIDEIILAWAITVHKFQGSQSKEILLILASEAQIMMTKELVYTAFTRAEKMLHVMGHANMLRVAPTRSSIRKRYTNLIKLLEEHKKQEILFDRLK